jgi:hypothetical protein
LNRSVLSSASTAAFALAAVILGTAVFWPALGGYFVLDDFGLLTLVRFQDHPFESLVADHMPGSVYYRPLGIMLWWLSERVFGADAGGHYALNLGLHVANAVALYALIAMHAERRWHAALAALAYVVHPIGIGTSLWLSDRFDLLAGLFGLLAVRSAMLHVRDIRTTSAVAAGIFLMLALLAKEVGVAAVVAVGATWLMAADTLSARRRFVLTTGLGILLAGFMLARSVVLADPSADLLLADTSLLQHVAAGIASWWRGWIDYASVWAQLGHAERICLTVGAVLFALFALSGAMTRWSRDRLRLLAAGLSLWLIPSLLSAPMTGRLALGISVDTGPILLALDARYFYVSFAGFVLGMWSLAAFQRPLRNGGNSYVAILAVALILPLTMMSHRLAAGYRDESLAQYRLVTAAQERIGMTELPSKGCRIFLLDSGNWMFAWVADEAIKATADDFARVAGCLIQTEHTPWYHVVAADSFDPDKAWPLVVAREDGQALASLRIGRADVLYLNMTSAPEPRSFEGAIVLAWNGSSFEDVSDDIVAGRRRPRFHCNRLANQCPEESNPVAE